MKREAVSHTKMKRLCRRLDLPLWQGVGLLESIWHVTAREAPRGDIGKLSDEDIALAIDYRGDESKLIEALVNSGWIDRDPAHRLAVHDWHQHCEDSVHMRLARSQQSFVGGYVPKLTKLPTKEREVAAQFFGSCAHVEHAMPTPGAQNGDLRAHEEHGASTADRLPLPIPITLTNPSSKPEGQRAPDGISPEIWSDFQNHYAESGKPVNDADWRKAAMEAATQDLSGTVFQEQVIPALMADLPEWADREVKMIPFPGNWLKNRPWTRKGKYREPSLTPAERKQREIDRQWEDL